jgi:hypothetical protein
VLNFLNQAMTVVNPSGVCSIRKSLAEAITQHVVGKAFDSPIGAFTKVRGTHSSQNGGQAGLSSSLKSNIVPPAGGQATRLNILF